MTLKNKISLLISLLFTVIFAIAAIVIYVLFSDFRKEEFETRLKEKAISSIILLVEVEQVDRHLLKIIDENSIHRLYDEKTLIFDAEYQLIYSSLDDTKIQWTIADLKYLKTHKTFFKKENEHEIYGVFYDTNDKDYFALISAKDNYGKRKLEYLLYILIITYIISTAITWFITHKAVKKLLYPLDLFHTKIKGINEQNLDTRLLVKSSKDEIDLLADEFNQMIERIDESYKKQQEFTSNASHELRTPIARLMAQIENKIMDNNSNSLSIEFYRNILSHVNQLSDLTNSLLLLSKLDAKDQLIQETYRIDELIFDAFEKTQKLFPDFKIEFEMADLENLEIIGNKALTEIAMTNLFKNAYLYSDDKAVKVNLSEVQNRLIITMTNNGKTLTKEEQKMLFEPFMRGENAKNRMGLGLGLRIVKRILTQQNAEINYTVSSQNLNVFTAIFG